MTRRRLLALVLAPTLLLGLGLGAALVVDARARQVDVDRADAVALRYEERLSHYREVVVRELEAADATDPDAVARVLARHRDDVPTLGATSQRGAAASPDYGAARREQSVVTEAMDRLDDVVVDTRTAQRYLVAARRALEVDPNALAPGTFVTSGAPLRAQLLPPMRTTLASFEAVEAPRDAAAVRDAVRRALTHVITEAEALAARLDAGQSGSFQYAEEYTAARTAVTQYEERTRADLREALDNVLAGDGVGR